MRPLLQALYEIPVLGSLLRIAAGIVRLPQLRSHVDHIHARLNGEEARMQDVLAWRERLDRHQASLEALEARVGALEERLAGVDARLGAAAADVDNMNRSVPVALRELARELQGLRAERDAKDLA